MKWEIRLFILKDVHLNGTAHTRYHTGFSKTLSQIYFEKMFSVTKRVFSACNSISIILQLITTQFTMNIGTYNNYFAFLHSSIYLTIA